jgi:glycosyltransferase involved in cell wall biosynthesis
MNTHGSELLLSIVVPAHNEESNVRPLTQEVSAALADMGGPWELIVVNDGSVDNTRAVLREEAGRCTQLRVISLKKRSGQTAALDCGLRNARGKYIAMLDADLQNDPRDIPKMLDMITAGQCDMVSGWRRQRHDPWIRLVSTRIANKVRNLLTRERIHDSASGIKVFRRECISRVKLYNGLHRFLPTLVKLEGYRVSELPVNHRSRRAGVAKYGVWNRVFKALRDTFAVRWMQSRQLKYEIEKDVSQDD